jgi:hypothetical protein
MVAPTLLHQPGLPILKHRLQEGVHLQKLRSCRRESYTIMALSACPPTLLTPALRALCHKSSLGLTQTLISLVSQQGNLAARLGFRN